MMLGAEIVAHHLRLFGFAQASAEARGNLLVVEGGVDAAVLHEMLECGAILVALSPNDALCTAFSVLRRESSAPPPSMFRCEGSPAGRWARLRTLHGSDIYHHPGGRTVLRDEKGDAAWLWLHAGRGGILFVGTALAADLTRYRQGDPEQTAPQRAMWGIPGERPLYLFEAQLAGEDPSERHADWWGKALANAIETCAGIAPVEILPGGAKGAIILTGDDDQAAMSNYERQLEILGDAPITYFLHPCTKHDKASMARLFAGREVDLGIHPDALNAPRRYAQLFGEQARWFERLTGRPPLSVRNHGYLNDGYWGHLSSWLARGVAISSNIPGLDGRVVNGSLLPARVGWQGDLTQHWSVLTAIGDGVRFALGMTPDQAADCIHALADRIRTDEVPGLIVLNLHPDNVDKTASMHDAVLELRRGGFHAWTMRECVAWFDARDGIAHREPVSLSERADGFIPRLRSLVHAGFRRRGAQPARRGEA
jgi:hypothetical protein